LRDPLDRARIRGSELRALEEPAGDQNHQRQHGAANRHTQQRPANDADGHGLVRPIAWTRAGHNRRIPVRLRRQQVSAEFTMYD
jgi:hypothetical protein